MESSYLNRHFKIILIAAATYLESRIFKVALYATTSVFSVVYNDILKFTVITKIKCYRTALMLYM